MHAWFSKFIFSLQELWRTLEAPQKVSIIGVGILTGIALGVVIYLGSRPNFTVLYANMSGETAQKVISLIDSEGVEYKTRNEGRTVLVPADMVSTLQGKIRAAGIEVSDAGSGKGWDLFDKTQLGLSQEELRVKQQRAKQGEIEKMLQAFPGVKRAKVELAYPSRRASILRGVQKNPTASVLLVMMPGRMLTPSQVTAVRYQVAAAVEGLSPENVTISDNYGNLLARRHSGNPLVGDTNSQLAIRRQIELDLEEKAEAVLRPFIGPHGVTARVSAEIDFDKVERVNETYDAQNKAAIQEKKVTEEQIKEGAQTAGVTGTAANVVSVKNAKPVNSGTGQKSQNTTQTTESQYIVPKKVERIQSLGARIKRISVAVSIARQGGDPIPAATLEKYKRLVTSAVGADVKGRNDLVELVEEKAAPPVEVPSSFSVSDITDNIRTILNSGLLRILGGVILLLFVYRIFKRQISTDVQRMDLAPVNAEDMYLPKSEEVARLEGGQENELSPQQLIEEKSKTNPELLAQALESWLMQSDKQ